MMRIRRPLHPGRILVLEFLEPLDMSPGALAKALNVPRNRVTRLVNGQIGFTTDTAFRLARFFGNGARFWLNLQVAYDVRTGEPLAEGIAREVRPLELVGAV
jgi:addiction module HigA family antidote